MSEHADQSSDLEQTRELLERARGGEAGARDELFLRYRRRLEAFVRERLPQQSQSLVDTQDLVQEVSLRAFESLPRFEHQGIGSFWAFLRRIALNQLIDLGRKVGRRGPSVPIPDGSSQLPAASATAPADRIIRQEEFALFDAALEHVPERQRHALLLRLELGLDYGVIAKECGFPSGDAARMAISRGLKQVAEEMSRGESEPRS